MSYEWFTDIGNYASELASNAFQFLNENEWAANMVAGAASGAASHYLQEDKQAHERDLLREKQRFEVDVNAVKPADGGVDIAAYSGGLLGGSLTNGVLSPKKVK